MPDCHNLHPAFTALDRNFEPGWSTGKRALKLYQPLPHLNEGMRRSSACTPGRALLLPLLRRDEVCDVRVPLRSNSRMIRGSGASALA